MDDIHDERVHCTDIHMRDVGARRDAVFSILEKVRIVLQCSRMAS